MLIYLNIYLYFKRVEVNNMCSGYYALSETPKKMPNGSKIHLIGINHRDRIEGPRKLEQVLQRIKPDLILHDFSYEDHKTVCDFLDDTQTTIEKEIANAKECDSVMETILHYTIPFPVVIGNAYAEENGISVHYVHIPNISRARIRLSEDAAIHLYKSSKEDGEIDARAIWRINNALTHYYGSIPTTAELNEQWDYLKNSEGNFAAAFRYFARSFIDPSMSRKLQRMADVITVLAEKDITVVFPLAIGQITDNYGTVYRKVKKLGVQREALL